MKRITAFLLLLSLLFLFSCSSCGQKNEEEENAYLLQSPKNGVYYCAETGVTYVKYPAVYLPQRLGKEVYAIHEKENGVKQRFYELSEGTGQKYLMQADKSEDGKTYPLYIIAAQDYKMPTLSDMLVGTVVVCSAADGADYFWHSANILGYVNTGKYKRAMVEAYENGVAEELPVDKNLTARVVLIFAPPSSESLSNPTDYEYADIAYTLYYDEYEDGSAYMWESDTGVCLRVTDGLFDEGVLWDTASGERPW